MRNGFTDEGLAALDAALARHVERAAVPGLVALVACDGQAHVAAAGHLALGGRAIGQDAIFRIASMTKPIVGAAAMLLVEDGAMALSDPVERWLPELAGRRVLRSYDAALTDTVPAARPITVEDVLSFRLGFGCIFTPQGLPVVEAEAKLRLNTLGPPWPPTPLTPGEWIAALGSLPLLDQPGEAWRYNTGATVTGVLIERVTGAPLAEVLRSRIFEPLGMTDTGFVVPSAKLHRFTSMYAPAEIADRFGVTADGSALALIDRPDGWYAAPPALPDGAASLVSTVDDLYAFTAMLAGDGGGLLAPESVASMLRDRTTPRDHAEMPWFFGDNAGWGLMMAVPRSGVTPSPGAPKDGRPYGYGWDGGSGTTWRTDPATGLTGILLTQRMVTSPEPPEVVRDFWSAAYAALAS